MKKVAIVTGANGFIGKNVVLQLVQKGYFVYAITTDPGAFKDYPADKISNLVLFFEDYPKLLDLISERPIEMLIHCAWQGVWGPAFKDYELQMRNAVNAGKTMELAAQLQVKKFVLLSTVNVLETKKVINESYAFKKLRPTTNYAMAKLSAEMICRTLSCSNGVEFNCAYIAMVYGEENRSMMVPNVVISKLLAGESPNLIEGNGLYDLIYVEDVAKGLVAIGEKGMNLKSYYLGSRTLRSFKEIFTQVRDILNPNIELRFGVYPDENHIDYSLVNLDELFEDTGYEVSKDFENHIRVTASWVKDNLLVEKK